MTEFKIIGYNNDRPSVIDEITCSIDGSIQIDSANVARLKFQLSGPSPHALGEIAGEQDGVNGGQLEFYTKVDTGSVTEKLRINNAGAVGIGGANYGTSGQVLTSNGSGAPVSWTTPSAGGGITEYATFTYQPATEQIVTNTFTRLEYNTTNTIGGSDITLDATTNIGRITLATTGVYMVNYYSTGYVFTGGARVIPESMIFVNPNTGIFSQEVGTRSFTYLRQANDPENTAGVSYLLTVSASNTEIELRFKTADLPYAKMKALCCGITIVKIA